MNKAGLIAKISIKYVLPTCIWKYFWRISRYFAFFGEFRGISRIRDRAKNIRSPVKRRSPGSWLAPQQDELNRIQAVRLLRLPSLKINRKGFDRQTLRLFQESIWEKSCREWTSTLYYLGNRTWRPSFPKFAFFITKIYSPGVIHYTKQASWMTLILKYVQGITR